MKETIKVNENFLVSEDAEYTYTDKKLALTKGSGRAIGEGAIISAYDVATKVYADAQFSEAHACTRYSEAYACVPYSHAYASAPFAEAYTKAKNSKAFATAKDSHAFVESEDSQAQALIEYAAEIQKIEDLTVERNRIDNLIAQYEALITKAEELRKEVKTLREKELK